MRHIRPGRLRREEKWDQVLGLLGHAAIVRHAAPFQVPIATLALTLRAGALLGLQWQDIDVEKGVVAVRRSVWDKKIQTPKTKKSVRTIGLSLRLRGGKEDLKVYAQGKEKGPPLGDPRSHRIGLPVIAGAGFEPATFGL